MQSLKNTYRIIIAYTLFLIISGPATPLTGGGPTDGAVAKYLAIYNENPEDIGNSWRLYIRPRNGACLLPTGNGYRSPSADTLGQTPGHDQSATIHPPNQTCNNKFKSYIPIDIPSSQAIYDTFVNYHGAYTKIDVTIANTKAARGSYFVTIYLLPMGTREGKPDRYNSRVAGVSFN